MSKYKKLEQRIYDNVRKALNGIALSMRNDCVKNIQKVSKGRVYGDHTASKAGDYPNVDTGNLISNIFNDMVNNELTARFGVRNSVEYARRLEFGFIGVDSLGRKYNQEPRPFIKPTYEKYKDNIVPLVEKAIERAING